MKPHNLGMAALLKALHGIPMRPLTEKERQQRIKAAKASADKRRIAETEHFAPLERRDVDLSGKGGLGRRTAVQVRDMAASYSPHAQTVDMANHAPHAAVAGLYAAIPEVDMTPWAYKPPTDITVSPETERAVKQALGSQGMAHLLAVTGIPSDMSASAFHGTQGEAHTFTIIAATKDGLRGFAKRKVTVFAPGKVITVENLAFESHQSGSGLRMLATEASALQRLARQGWRTEIRCFAAGSIAGHLTGYFAWPQMGYVAADLDRPMGPHGETIEHLMSSRGGAAWWRLHGRTFEARFDPSPGSYSMRRLSHYLTHRAGKVVKAEETDIMGLDEAFDALMDRLPTKGAPPHRFTMFAPMRGLGPAREDARRKWPFKASLDFQGIPIDIEQRVGDTREGVDRDGTPWKVTMCAHYGEVRKTGETKGAKGMDGDRLDVYVGPDRSSQLVVVVQQLVPDTQTVDEEKVMLGFPSEANALACYDRMYTRPGFRGGHRVMTLDELKAWMSAKSNAGKPLNWERMWERLRERKGLNKAGAGPFIGPRGGKWSDPQHTVPWHAQSISGASTDDRIEAARAHAVAMVQNLEEATDRLNALGNVPRKKRDADFERRADLAVSAYKAAQAANKAADQAIRDAAAGVRSPPLPRRKFGVGVPHEGASRIARLGEKVSAQPLMGTSNEHLAHAIKQAAQSARRSGVQVYVFAGDFHGNPMYRVSGRRPMASEVQNDWMMSVAPDGAVTKHPIHGGATPTDDPIQKALDAANATLDSLIDTAGCLELPEGYDSRLWLNGLFKAAHHKYVKRVLTGKAKPKYRYYYNAAAGGGVHSHAHMVEGASFRADGGHWHIHKTDGDTLHVRHDESGAEKTMTRADLAARLEKEHAAALKAHAEKRAQEADEVARHGTSEQQKRLGVMSDNEIRDWYHRSKSNGDLSSARSAAERARERGDASLREDLDRHHRLESARKGFNEMMRYDSSSGFDNLAQAHADEMATLGDHSGHDRLRERRAANAGDRISPWEKKVADTKQRAAKLRERVDRELMGMKRVLAHELIGDASIHHHHQDIDRLNADMDEVERDHLGRRPERSEVREHGSDAQRQALGVPTKSQEYDARMAERKARVDAHRAERSGPEFQAPSGLPGAQASKSDINIETAERAYGGTSHVPEQRADEDVRHYVAHMQSLADDLAARVTPETASAAAEAFNAYRKTYAEKLHSMLHARSGVHSTMVAGPANFNTKQNAKRGGSYERRAQELRDWSDKAQKDMRKQFPLAAKPAPQAVTAPVEPKPREKRTPSSDDGSGWHWSGKQKTPGGLKITKRDQRSMSVADPTTDGGSFSIVLPFGERRYNIYRYAPGTISGGTIGRYDTAKEAVDALDAHVKSLGSADASSKSVRKTWPDRITEAQRVS